MTTRTCISPVSAIARSAALLAALALLGTGSVLAQTVNLSAARDTAEAGMLDIRSLAPDIELEIRYAGSDNFTAQPVPGYEAPKCFLLAPVATALARLERGLRAEGYGLRIYDCYRPAQAVQAFVVWAHDPKEQSRKARQYPGLDKPALLGGYIAETSGHSRAATVDLTLLDCRGGGCTPLDMGTEFDFFGPRAHTDAPDVTPAQHRNRVLLRTVMERQGFENYPMEWWHYTFKPEPSPGTAFDVPVR